MVNLFRIGCCASLVVTAIAVEGASRDAERQRVLDQYGLGPSQAGMGLAPVPAEVIFDEPPPASDGSDPPPVPMRWRLSYLQLPREGHQVVTVEGRTASGFVDFDSHWRLRAQTVVFDARSGFDLGLGIQYTRGSVAGNSFWGIGPSIEPMYVQPLADLVPWAHSARVELGTPLGLGYDTWTIGNQTAYGYGYNLAVEWCLACRWRTWDAMVIGGYERSYHPFSFSSDQADVDSSARLQGSYWGLGFGRSF